MNSASLDTAPREQGLEQKMTKFNITPEAAVENFESLAAIQTALMA